MANNATKWPQMIAAVYDSFNTGDHSGDATTRRVIDRAVSWLVKGKALSPKLQSALVTNINQRTRYNAVVPDEPIRFTRHQIDYAKRTHPEWFGLIVEEEDVSACGAERLLNDVDLSANRAGNGKPIQQPFSTLAAIIQQAFSDLSAAFPTYALDLARQLVSEAAEKGGFCPAPLALVSPKEETMEEEKRNHEPSGMTSASPVHEKPELQPGAHDGTEPLVIHPEQDNEKEHGGRNGPRHADALTIWVKPDKQGTIRASGYLDAGSVKYALSFAPFYTAFAAIERTPENAAWQHMITDEIADTILAVERSSQGIAASATMSALYAARDSMARKPPVAASTVVVLEWTGDQPTGAIIIDGDERRVVDLEQQTGDRFKGGLKLAAVG